MKFTKFRRFGLHQKFARRLDRKTFNIIPGRRVGRSPVRHTLTMAYAQSSSYVEIQQLKEKLAISKKKEDRYAHLSASRLQIVRIELISYCSQSQHLPTSWTLCEIIFVIPARRNCYHRMF